MNSTMIISNRTPTAASILIMTILTKLSSPSFDVDVKGTTVVTILAKTMNT